MDAFKKKAIALSALPLALLFGAAFQSSTSVLDQLKAIQSQLSGLQSHISSLEAQVAALANKVPRKFYLTRTTHDGAHALTACARGYHMASMWEILDTSNLCYDTELGITTGDSGSGPPGNFDGWIRTGYLTSGSGPPGNSNCQGWTSSGPADNGSAAALRSYWNSTEVNVVTPWSTATLLCGFSIPVWCVQD